MIISFFDITLLDIDIYFYDMYNKYPYLIYMIKYVYIFSSDPALAGYFNI